MELCGGGVQAASSKKVFENLETSLIYSKFRAIATRVRDQVAVISERVTEQAPEHAELLEECKKVREEEATGPLPQQQPYRVYLPEACPSR